MKSSFVFLLLFFSCISFSQNDLTIYYSPIFINACTGLEESNVNFELVDSNNYHYYVDSSSNKRIKVPKLGRYKIILNDTIRKGIIINIVNDGVYRDSINLKCLTVNRSTFPYYMYCGKRANDYMADYYHNGVLRIEGVFLNSILLDTLKEYYSNGKILSKLISTHKKAIGSEYYENGIMSSFFIVKKNREKHYLYYSNGNISCDYTKKKDKEIENKYYASGGGYSNKTNGEETIFYENGEIKEMEWKERLNFWDKLKRYDSNYPVINHWVSYNSDGTKKRWLRYVSYGNFIRSSLSYHLIPFPEMFVGIEFFKDGNEIVRIYKLENHEFNLLREVNNFWVIDKTFKESELYDYIYEIENELK